MRMPRPRGRVVGLALWLAVQLVAAISADAQDAPVIAVIVHPDNPIKDLTLDDLRRLYLGSTTLFADREPVVLLESSDLRSRFYRTALGMGEDRLKRHWVSRVFSGQSGSPPREIRRHTELLEYVERHPGAIAFVDAGVLDGTVKALTLDGHQPTDPGYPLR